MRVLNFKTPFVIGTIVKVKKDYKSGSITLVVDTEGIVDKITIESFPDLGLFNLRIIHMIFGQDAIGMEESIARGYFEVI